MEALHVWKSFSETKKNSVNRDSRTATFDSNLTHINNYSVKELIQTNKPNLHLSNLW